MEEWKGQEERKRRRKNGRNREKENGRSYGRWERRRDCEYESGRNRESEFNEEEERKLMMRREVLMGQLEEARWLKQNIEKRSKKVRLTISTFSSIKVEDVISVHSRSP